ncbi:DHA1 family chloramphenicol resistance protein-like MFS transporter [Rhizobium sp. PP-CC-2G-626]|nr:DHA1 family chloramphenicol resistance protein-like MFS transporter [Rhizobium sp. PP-CC-2G-626]
MSDRIETAPDALEKPKASIAAPIPPIPLAVYLLGLSLFAMGSAEFLMGGILPMIAKDLAITLPTAGTLISAFSIGALVGGPPLAILTLHWSTKRTLFVSQAVFIVALIVGLMIDGYWALLVTRIVMGLAYACFWAVAAVTAFRLVQANQRAKAFSIVSGGLTLAMIVGGPAGTLISEIAGWRVSFWTVSVLSAAAAVTAFIVVPDVRASDGSTPDAMAELRAMKRPSLWAAYATTALTTAAYMGTFSYLGALLLDVTRLPNDWLAAVLVLFGIGAFVGLSVGGRTADHHAFATLICGIAGLVVVSVAFVFLSSNVVAAVSLVFLLGFAGFLLNPAVWGRVYVISPDAPTLVGATNSSAFQLGLTLAPLFAGLAISGGFGLAAIGWVGAAIAITSLGTALLDRKMSRS